jgi:hypothetical protein
MLSVVAPNNITGVYLNNVLRLSYDQITTWAQYKITFYSRNLRFFVVSYSVCPWQAFPTLYVTQDSKGKCCTVTISGGLK